MQMKKYIHRSIEKEIIKASGQFPVITLTGPRQTGKSTLLRHLFPNHAYVTLDDPLIRETAENDPKLFLSQNKKLIIDEIQYVPGLLPYIKMAVDKDRSIHGRFITTGSQHFPLMKGLTESLAGRVALFELLTFSLEESGFSKKTTLPQCFKSIFSGFYPEIIAHGVDRVRFYSSYLQTYLERDIRQISSVHDIRVFQNFLELLAARAGALMNLNEISNECGISFTTANRWLSLLESTRIVYLLRPFHNNISKRVVKTPKLYFTDTGLLSYLLRYPDATTLMRGPQSGAFFENLVLMELLKYRLNHNKNFELYFYRDSNHNEIDIVIDQGQSLSFVELKQTLTPKAEHFKTLKKIVPLLSNAKGYLASFSKEQFSVSENASLIHWTDIIKLIQ